MERKIKLWMPVTKNTTTGEYQAILSDTSLDRDDEMMAKELIHDFANCKSLKALANHDNKMQSWVGGWNNLAAINKGNHTALTANPWFFSKEANPLAAQIEKQVDEAIAKGENPGISIGAIIYDSEMRDLDHKQIRTYTKGEILEATWVPIQSNRNASYGMVAKRFGIAFNGGQKMTSFTQKDIDTAVEKKEAEYTEKVSELETQLKKAQDELTKTKEQLKKEEELEDELDKEKEKVEESEKKVKQLETDLATEKKQSLEKAALVSKEEDAGDGNGKDKGKPSDEETEKAIKAGKLPIFTS